MTGEVVLWALLGLAVGIGHVWLLRRASLSGSPGLETGVLRLLLSGGILAAMALLGGILPGAAGWAVGFAASVAVYASKDASCRRSKSSAIR